MKKLGIVLLLAVFTLSFVFANGAKEESTTNSGALKRIRSISNYLVNMLHRRSFYHSFGSFNMKDSSNSASNSAGKMETIQEEKAANSLNGSVPNPMPDTVIPIQSDSCSSEMNKAKSQFASLLRSHTLTDTKIMNATYVCTIYIIKNKSVQNYQEQYEAMFFGDTVYFYESIAYSPDDRWVGCLYKEYYFICK